MSATAPSYPAKPEAVYFFATCLVDLFYPQAGLAGIELLEREGIRVVFPQGQTCCGQPAYTSGYHDQAREVAAQQLDLFPAPWPIVVPSGSCGGMLRRQYPPLFAGTARAGQATEIAGRTWELTDFLLNVCKVRLTDRGEPLKVALHSSCSARRELGVAPAASALLQQLAQVELVEPERAEECCGFGGTFAVRHPEISAAMTSDKVAALRATGARSVVTGDCGCMLNIAGCAERQGQPLPAEHIASFLHRRTRDS